MPTTTQRQYVADMESDQSPADPLDREIAEKVAAIAAKERELEFERVELRTLQRAAALRPVAPTVRAPSSGQERARGGGKGRVKGSLTRQWQTVMSRFVELGNEFQDAEGWVTVAELAGYQLTPRGTADWLRRGVGSQLGYIERQGDTYRVSYRAIEKFSFARNPVATVFAAAVASMLPDQTKEIAE